MRRASALTFLLLAVAAAPARAAETSEAAAQKAAEAWLKLIDAGQYGASWDEASASFRKAVSRSTWEKKASAAREPLGTVVTRKVASKQLAHELPGAPDGTYVVLTFETKFEHKERGIETVTMMLDDGKFRGAGYFIR
jgi:predicted membrane-bound mannosyltransferase